MNDKWECSDMLATYEEGKSCFIPIDYRSKYEKTRKKIANVQLNKPHTAHTYTATEHT